ncbi:MAG: tRNA (adenosine(37)-N6)-dimethylallyltransferase MiaA [Planctomycetaceae bacterium]|nr:tRNA (adenosine(37)-N6)-dimethylallyltransferase MiaA [Planctomycetaceae bacterium]
MNDVALDPKLEINRCWFLTGPTASGKTCVGIELAKCLDAEIISMDSMAIYRGMNIGTAKPTVEEQNTIPHHLVDIVDPDQLYSVSDYVDAAQLCIQQIRARGKQVLFVGGTPLYLKSLLRGTFVGPPADEEFRQAVEQEIKEVGIDALHARLQQVDPLSAAKFHPNDVRRIVRALEVYKATGQPISHLQLQFDQARSAEDCRVFVLDWPRPELHQRINQRVDRMFVSGLVEEVRELESQGPQLGRTARQAVGYAEVISFLAGEMELDFTIHRTKSRTRQFAKRQITWFRSLGECRWCRQSNERTAVEIAETIVADGTDSQS